MKTPPVQHRQGSGEVNVIGSLLLFTDLQVVKEKPPQVC